MDVDWSELPSELVDMVAKKLTVYRDYIRFCAVCVKWRDSISLRPNHLPIQLPWLMLPFSPSDESRCSFFDLSEKKFHWFDLPETHPSRCCGSSQGWLVFVEEHCSRILVFNPFTRDKYYLPPLKKKTTFPDALDFNTKIFVREYLRVVLSSSLSLTNDYIALAILKKTKDLAFCKQGVEGWSVIEDARSYCEDAIYYNGAFYAVNKQGSIAICDLRGISPVVTLITPPPISGHDHLYLVDSFGKLLLVARYLGVVSDRAPDLIYGTNKFRVFTLDSSKPEWVEKKSLGDQMLFVGGDSSVCLSASDFPGRIGNCIYFTYNYDNSRMYGYCELGVFDLKVGQIMPLQFGTGTRKSVFPPPMWVTPNPCLAGSYERCIA